MERAIGETERRRAKQQAHNIAHGITPTGVSKRIKDIIDGVYDIETAQRELKAAQEMASYRHLDEKTLTREIKQLEKEMLACAKNLEFERAAQLRDRLKEVKHLLFGVKEHDE
jgi:excinuclease ABC subunit B